MALTDDSSVAIDHTRARRAVSPEQRMHEFHTARLNVAAVQPFGAPALRDAGPEAGEETALKRARAEAVDFVVKAFAAVDKNVALAEKARVVNEKNRAETERALRDAEAQLAAARRMREEAECELASARQRSEKVLSEARAEGDRLVGAALARCAAEADATRRRLADALAPVRDLVGLAGATIDAFVGASAAQDTAAVETVDVRDGATAVAKAGITRLHVLASPVEDD